MGVDTKPRGYYFETNCVHKAHLRFKTTKTMYTWCRVPAYAFGILYGKLWVSNEGETQIVNHRTNETCLMKYFPAKSLFSKEPLNRVVCIIRDENMMGKYVIEGDCNDELYFSTVLTPIRVLKISDELLSKLNLSKKILLWKKPLLEY